MDDKRIETTQETLVYRLVPCPPYDVSGTECWLEDMAREGLLLHEDGFFLGIATFQKTTPRIVRYRLQAAQKSTSMWADHNGNPDDEEIELSKQFGWEYVAKRGEFHIYRTEDCSARELHTDKEVQAIAMNAMRKRQRENIFNCIFFSLVYPYIVLRGKVLLPMIHIGTIPILLMMLAIVWMSVNSIFRAVKLIKLRKQVLNGSSLGSGSDWKKGTSLYHLNNILRKCAVVIAVLLLLKCMGKSVIYEDYVPLDSYKGEVPFKTMEDFVPNGTMHLMNMKVGNLNTVREWSDILSEVNFEWDEAGTVTCEDGTSLSGGLEVIYHETKADWIAKRLVKEYLRKGKQEKEYVPLEFEMQEMEQAIAYETTLHFPTIILQKGNKILFARFYTSGAESIKYELSEWAGFLAESLL